MTSKPKIAEYKKDNAEIIKALLLRQFKIRQADFKFVFGANILSPSSLFFPLHFRLKFQEVDHFFMVGAAGDVDDIAGK